MRLSRLSVLLLLVPSCGSFGAQDPRAADASTGSSGSSTSSSSGSSGSSGPSQPETLVTGLSTPLFVEAVDGGLYWVSTIPDDAGTSARIHRCELTGCAGSPPQIVDERALQLTADDDAVVWRWGTSVRACAVGPTCTPRTVYEGEPGSSVRLHEKQLYFTTVAAETSLRRCSLDACASPESLWTSASLGLIAFSGSDVYVTGGAPARQLVRLRGATPRTLGTLPGLPISMTVMGSHVYFVSESVRIFHCDATTTCSPVPFHDRTSPIFEVRAIDGAIYFTVPAGIGTSGSIQRCRPEDCTAPTTLVADVNPSAFTVHGEWIYFVDRGNGATGNGSIRRFRIPG